jgi:hypothetical protein
MNDEPRNLLDQAAALRKRALTPEQLERREWVAKRNRAIQEHVKAPKSGTFGSGKPPQK